MSPKNTVLRTKNLFLSVLPEEDFKILEPHLEQLETKSGEVIHKLHERIRYVYFPENAVISVVAQLEDGTSIETGVIGNEGVAGIGAVLSDDGSSQESIVQVSGKCYRLRAEIFKREFNRGGELNRLALRFVFAFIAQISQNAACYSRHRIESRLARWLLALRDRVGDDEIHIVQEFIAQVLGTNRPSVSENAGKLQQRGLIKYVRGHIEILDSKGLEDTSCECYQVIKDVYDKYLNKSTSSQST